MLHKPFEGCSPTFPHENEVNCYCKKSLANWVFSEIGLYGVGVITIEWTVELFMKMPQKWSQRRTHESVRAGSRAIPLPHLLLCFLRVQKPPSCHSAVLSPCLWYFFFVFPLLPWKGEGCWGCRKAGCVISHRVRLLMRPSSQHWQIKCNGKACLLDNEHNPGCQLTPFNCFSSWQKETISNLSGSLVRWWLSLCHLAGV